MALEQQNDDSLIFSNALNRESASAAGARAQPRLENLADLATGDATDVWRLARRLREEWRRERYSRLTPD